MKKALLFRLIFIFILIVGVSQCKISRFIVYNFADITDYKIFPERQLRCGEKKFSFPKAKLPNVLPYTFSSEKYTSFEQCLEKNKTVAFLVIRNDSIQYEHYFRGYDTTSIVASFSMAKSITSILIGCAIDDGFIKSVNEPVTNYIPELKENGFEKVTIEHLLQMTSGIDFKESYYNPLGDAATIYYGRDLEGFIKKIKLKRPPGIQFEYTSGSPQILGLVLRNALKGKTITEYLQEKIWSPIGMEYDASWSLDKQKNGLEKTFCCINARARDFAKIGRLYLNNGKWDSIQVVSSEWVERSTTIDTLNGSASYYQYQWWIPSASGDYMAEGILGQFIYVNPNKNLIIVRLGKKYGKVNWVSCFRKIAEAYK